MLRPELLVDAEVEPAVAVADKDAGIILPPL
jgi:hypothetical protein